jgi:23S rRNA U2552 (ribose-2'-O)-methylase RlmE/FtsJ
MEPVVCDDLYKELNALKRRIDDEPDAWEYRKRAINPYECVFSSFGSHHTDSYRNLRNTNEGEWRVVRQGKHTTNDSHHKVFYKNPIQVSLAAVHPISRAFFKMTELSHLIRKDPHPSAKSMFNEPVRVLHLAESPGGFVQSWRWHREREGFVDDTTCVTIEKHIGRDPWDRLREVSRGWKHPPHMIVGDLFNIGLQRTIKDRFIEDGVSLVTGDGGFDFSTDYCAQEEQATPLILAEMVVGLRALRTNGAFILKVFDVVTLPMIQILWVFWKCFRSFQLVKPKTSRACNSERYIVARGFRGMDVNLIRFLNTCDILIQSSARPIRTLFLSGMNASWDTMDPAFRAGISIVKSHMTTQINTIHAALRIQPDEPEEIRKHREIQSIKMARNWCQYYGIPISSSYITVYRPSSGRDISPQD